MQASTLVNPGEPISAALTCSPSSRQAIPTDANSTKQITLQSVEVSSSLQDKLSGAKPRARCVHTQAHSWSGQHSDNLPDSYCSNSLMWALCLTKGIHGSFQAFSPITQGSENDPQHENKTESSVSRIQAFPHSSWIVPLSSDLPRPTHLPRLQVSFLPFNKSALIISLSQDYQTRQRIRNLKN